MRIPVLWILALLVFALPPGIAAASQAGSTIPVYYFYSADCPECRLLRLNLLEPLCESYPEGRFRFHSVPLNSRARFRQMEEMLHARACQGSEFPLLILGPHCLMGLTEIRERVRELTEQLARTPPAPGEAPSRSSSQVLSLTSGVLLFAGLIDGVNPCAFATLVLLTSLLSCLPLPEAQRRRIVAGYVAGVFLAYFSIGLGLLQVLHWFDAWALQPVQLLAAAFCLIAALIQFQALFQQNLSAESRGKLSGLPESLRRQIHRLFSDRLGVSSGYLVSLTLGISVAILEGICTGQVYLPALMLLAQDNPWSARALGLLLVYNLAFILPLLILGILLLRLPRVWERLAWRRRLEPWLRGLLILVFLLLAAFLTAH